MSDTILAQINLEEEEDDVDEKQQQQQDEDEQQRFTTMAGLAFRRRWSALAYRAALHPEEMDQISLLPSDYGTDNSTDGWTLLHWVCCNAPPIEMVQSLFRYESTRRAARTQDRNGMTPLLCACACQASLDIISLLLESVPDCIHIYDTDGWTPLHFICSQVRSGEDHHHGDIHSRRGWEYSYAVVEKLLLYDATLPLVSDYSQRNPVKLLGNTYEVELQAFHMFHVANNSRTPMEVTGGGGTEPTSTTTTTTTNHPIAQHFFDRFSLDLVSGFWPLIRIMVDSVFRNDTILSEATILHRFAAFPDITVDLLRFALAMVSADEMALRQDALGNTPLHVAMLRQLQQQPQQRQPCLPLLHFLLLGQPKAAKVRNGQGLVPLQLLLDQPWNPVHAGLIEAFPAAVETCGLSDEHYPRVVALCDTYCDPTTIFEMLRNRPILVTASGGYDAIPAEGGGG